MIESSAPLNTGLIDTLAAAHREAFEAFFAANRERLDRTGRLFAKALESGRKILICGNGGSAADAQHFAGEIVGRFLRERRPYPAIALSTDTSILTAVGNDYGFEEIFARQVRAHGIAGDILLAISTSGNSPNVLRAIEAARERQMTIIGLTGRDGGRMAALCDETVVVPHPDTPRIQELHIFTLHAWCALLDELL